MTLFLIRLPYRSAPEPSPQRQFPLSQPGSEQEVERHRRQVVEHLREVRTSYSLERRIFL
jgi:hypothetical protein